MTQQIETWFYSLEFELPTITLNCEETVSNTIQYDI